MDYAAGDVKHQVGNTVKAACYGYRFQSFGEYKALLAAYNVCAEEVKGEINGKPYQGIVYSATNDKGEKTGNPVKASRIGKSVGYEAVQRRMEKSGEASERETERAHPEDCSHCHADRPQPQRTGTTAKEAGH